MADVSVIILTFNEEENIRQAVESVAGWAKRVFVVDSFSTDRTVEIARDLPCHVVQHAFEDYSRQRNFALTELPIDTEWIFFLDADEWIPEELKNEIARLIERNPIQNGFYVNRRFIWMGRWIRRGYYPTWILRLFRRGHGRCEDRSVNEHIIVDGATGRLEHDMMHEDRKSIERWIERHNRYAAGEAKLLLDGRSNSGHIGSTFWGSQAQRKRWLRDNAWLNLPPVVRPLLYFSYRYLVRGGFLDGKEAFIYHAMQAFWYQLLIDAKYYEEKRKAEK